MLYDLLIKKIKLNKSPFCIPGHKGRLRLTSNHLDFKKLSMFDVTELDSTDDLYNPGVSILEIEEKISSLYNSGISVISTGGNTLCIQTMLRLFLPTGGYLLVARNVHKSVINAMSMLKIEPIFIECPIFGQIRINDLKNTLRSIENISKIKGLFITSPSYFGNIADINGIKQEIGNLPLLVDNAHGAHLKFLPIDLHPISLGADGSADSAHKTLPVLTGGAFFHVSKFAIKNYFNNSLTRKEIKSAMAFFGSTSPSFLTIISIEKCVEWLIKKAKTSFIFNLKVAKKIKNIAFKLDILDFFCDDPVRIVLDFSNYVCDNKVIRDYFNFYGIEYEFIFNKKIVLISSPFNEKNDWINLKRSLDYKNFSKNFKKNKKYVRKTFNYSLINQSLTLEESVFSVSEYVNTVESCGRICTEVACVCPPGIPIVFPGEIITLKKREELMLNKIFVIKVLK